MRSDGSKLEKLVKVSGQHPKVCLRAVEREDDRGLVEYGTSIRNGWLTTSGEAKLTELMDEVEK